MKKLILIFVALSFFSVCFAGSIQDMHKAVIAGKTNADVDGEIGITNYAGSSRNIGYVEGYFFGTFTTTTAGNVQYGHIYITDGNSLSLCLSLMSSNGQTIHLSAVSAALSDNTAYWVNIDMGSSFTLQAATDYVLAVGVGESGTIDIDQADAGGGIFQDDVDAVECGVETITTPGTDLSYNYPTIIFNNSAGDPS